MPPWPGDRRLPNRYWDRPYGNRHRPYGNSHRPYGNSLGPNGNSLEPNGNSLGPQDARVPILMGSPLEPEP